MLFFVFILFLSAPIYALSDASAVCASVTQNSSYTNISLSSSEDIHSPDSANNYISVNDTLQTFWSIALSVMSFIGGFVLSVLSSIQIGFILNFSLPFSRKLGDIVSETIFKKLRISLLVWTLPVFLITLVIIFFTDYYIIWLIGLLPGIIVSIPRFRRSFKNLEIYFKLYRKYINFSRRVEVLVTFYNEFERK